MNDKIVCTGVCQYDYDELDDEIILFLIDYDKIVILNKSAAVIWKIIIENIGSEISIIDLANILSKLFDSQTDNIKVIVDDIKELLEAFVLENIMLIREENI